MACGKFAVLWILVIVDEVITWQFQILLFATISLLCVFMWKLQRLYQQKKTLDTFRSSPAYVTNVFTLTEPIVNGRGHLKINDTLWSIQGPDLNVGAQVKVTGIEGMILTVEPV